MLWDVTTCVSFSLVYSPVGLKLPGLNGCGDSTQSSLGGRKHRRHEVLIQRILHIDEPTSSQTEKPHASRVGGNCISWKP